MDFSQVSVKFDLHLTVTIQPHEWSFLLRVTSNSLCALFRGARLKKQYQAHTCYYRVVNVTDIPDAIK
jgi:hypothetical protein